MSECGYWEIILDVFVFTGFAFCEAATEVLHKVLNDRSEETRHEEGLPKSIGAHPCPDGFNMEQWLRSMQAKRVALNKMCHVSKRATY